MHTVQEDKPEAVVVFFGGVGGRMLTFFLSLKSMSAEAQLLAFAATQK